MQPAAIPGRACTIINKAVRSSYFTDEFGVSLMSPQYQKRWEGYAPTAREKHFLFTAVGTSGGKRLTSYSPISNTVKWSSSLGQTLYDSYKKHGKNVEEYLGITSDVKRHWHLFMVRIHWWYENYGKKKLMIVDDIFDIKWYVKNTCFKGPAFAKELKNMRTYAYISAASGEIHEELRKYPNAEWRYHSYDQLYNQFYLPHWEEEEPTDIKDYMFDETDNISKSTSDALREILEEILPDITFEPVTKREILLELRTSSSFDVKNNKKVSSMNLKLDPKNKEANSFTDHLIVTETHIPKAPSEIRDAVVATPGSLNTHLLITRNLAKIVGEMKNSGMTPNPAIFKKRYKRVRKNDYSYQLDLSKAGLVFNHSVLILMFEVLDKKYPNCNFNKGGYFYTNIELYLKGSDTPVKPKRGHCLGYGNELQTIASIAMHYLALSRTDVNEVDTDAIFLNDDCCASFKHINDRTRYEISLELVALDLRFLINSKKSWSGDREFQFCEEYHSKYLDMSKSSILGLAIFDALEAVNIVHAKDIVNNFSEFKKTDEFHAALDIITTYWGDEFCDDTSYPYILGGWMDKRLEGMNISLRNLTVPTKEEYARLKACDSNFKFPDSMKGGTVETSLIPALEGAKLLRPEYKTLPVVKSTMWGDLKSIRHAYGKWRTSPDIFKGVYEKYAEERQLKYAAMKRSQKHFMKDFWEEVYAIYPNSNILPPDNMLEWGYYNRIYRARTDIFNSHSNAFTKYIKYLEEEKVISISSTSSVEADIRPILSLSNPYRSRTNIFPFAIESDQQLDNNLANISQNYGSILSFYMIERPREILIPLKLKIKIPSTYYDEEWLGHHYSKNYNSFWNGYDIIDYEKQRLDAEKILDDFVLYLVRLDDCELPFISFSTRKLAKIMLRLSHWDWDIFLKNLKQNLTKFLQEIMSSISPPENVWDINAYFAANPVATSFASLNKSMSPS